MKISRLAMCVGVAMAAGVILSEPAYAQGALFDSGTNFLNNLETLLTGTWARIIAIIAVVALGFIAMLGRMSWYKAGSVAGGIILVFGAAAIVDSIGANI